jgi:hypothetical protein
MQPMSADLTKRSLQEALEARPKLRPEPELKSQMRMKTQSKPGGYEKPPPPAPWFPEPLPRALTPPRTVETQVDEEDLRTTINRLREASTERRRYRDARLEEYEDKDGNVCEEISVTSVSVTDSASGPDTPLSDLNVSNVSSAAKRTHGPDDTAPPENVWHKRFRELQESSDRQLQAMREQNALMAERVSEMASIVSRLPGVDTTGSGLFKVPAVPPSRSSSSTPSALGEPMDTSTPKSGEPLTYGQYKASQRPAKATERPSRVDDRHEQHRLDDRDRDHGRDRQRSRSQASPPRRSSDSGRRRSSPPRTERTAPSHKHRDDNRNSSSEREKSSSSAASSAKADKSKKKKESKPKHYK